ncbi:MAG: TIGR00159 family protein [Gemmatimonadetes bacterium]|nr:TIGR00159 family protein [Gemmatimonadota bacterium]
MLNFLGNHWVLDVLDIGIVTVIFYKLYSFIKSTRAVTMFLGLMLIIGAGILAQVLGLHGLNWIISSLKTIWLIGFLIVFQPELRRALSNLGQNPLVRPFVARTSNPAENVDDIVNAAFEMADKRVGALIVVLGPTGGLKGVTETGTPIHAKITEELLLAIFTPKSPLHDGAVIIQGSQILAAGCILPLTQDPRLSRALGTRHRAGIGITEESDCETIIVSEETGTVSRAQGGHLQRRIDRDQLRDLLRAAMRETEAAEAA